MEKWKLKYIFCSVSWNAEMYFLKPSTTSQLKRTGNQSLYTFTCQCPWRWSVHTLQRRKWLFPIPHPLPRPLVPISLGQGHHIWPHRQCAAQFKRCHFPPFACEWCPLELCSATIRTKLANCLVLRLTPTKPWAFSWVTVASVSLAPTTVPGTE